MVRYAPTGECGTVVGRKPDVVWTQSCSNGIQYLEIYLRLEFTKIHIMGYFEKPRFFLKNLGFFL